MSQKQGLNDEKQGAKLRNAIKTDTNKHKHVELHVDQQTSCSLDEDVSDEIIKPVLIDIVNQASAITVLTAPHNSAAGPSFQQSRKIAKGILDKVKEKWRRTTNHHSAICRDLLYQRTTNQIIADLFGPVEARKRVSYFAATPTRQQPDYVIVFSKELYLLPRNEADHIRNYIFALLQSGIKCEMKAGQLIKNMYIIITFPENTLRHYASLFELNLENEGDFFVPYKMWDMRWFRNKFTDFTFKRKENEITSMERTMIAALALESIPFDPQNDSNRGLAKLLKEHGVLAAYPLHDGPADYDKTADEDDEMNDRQLLAKYWSNLNNWYKYQPLNLIHKYYGPEVAFYFAWLGFYNQMLLIAGVLGFLCFLISLIDMYEDGSTEIEEVCQSNITLCPVCYREQDCVFDQLSDSCLFAKLSFVFDNYLTMFFSVVMSFWSTIFLQKWKVYETTLKLRWNIPFLEYDLTMRPGFKDSAKHHHVSAVSGKLEPYIPLKNELANRMVVYGTLLCLLVIVYSALFGVIYYRLSINALSKYITVDLDLDMNVPFVALATSCMLQVVFVKVLSKFLLPLSVQLTEMEQPRTQAEYDESVVYKRFLLAFSNNYTPLFYIAFFKGTFYIPMQRRWFSALHNDICNVCGCIVALYIQVAFLLVLRSLIGNILELSKPYLCKWCRPHEVDDLSALHEHEQEYYLDEAERYIVVPEFIEMMVQYGFVTFFVAAFPLAPFCALINNILEIRLDATKFVRRMRRVVPQRQGKIEIWDKIIGIMTKFGILTNACVLAFTGDSVLRTLYRPETENFKGFLMSTLSEFSLNDSQTISPQPLIEKNDNMTICYYRGNRNPPDHPFKYRYSTHHWYDLGMRLLIVVVFEHVLTVLNSILTLFLPEMPLEVYKYLHDKHTNEIDEQLSSNEERAGTYQHLTKRSLF